MYVRYVILMEHQDTQKEMGVFQALAVWEDALLEQGDKLQDYESQWFNETLAWFNENVRTARNVRSRFPRATFWFKESAKECINRVQMLVLLLEQYGFRTERLAAGSFDYILYEDEHQVVALSREDVTYKAAHLYEKYRRRR